MDYSWHYARWHPNTPEHARGMIRYYSGLLADVSFDTALPALDIGCGFGYTLRAIADRGAKAFGVDVSEGQIARCLADGLDVELVDDTVGFLRARPGTYGLITGFDVLEHVEPAVCQELLVAVFGALAPGGSFVVTVPNGNSAIAGRYRYIDLTHTTAFTEASLTHLLHEGGFDSITVDAVESRQRPSRRRLLTADYGWYLAWRIARTWRRMQFIAELGDEGRSIPLSPNVRAVARRSAGVS